jgi:hypothetical protein
MSFYTASTSVSPTNVHQRPVREIRLDRATGRLLYAGNPRYDTLAQYIEQLASPLSQLSGAEVWSFYDPVNPNLTLLVECSPIDWCTRCDTSLDDCNCSF